MDSIEHQDIDIVACNDPFIEPHYAVSHLDITCLSSQGFMVTSHAFRELR